MALSDTHYAQGKNTGSNQRNGDAVSPLVAYAFGAKMLTQDFKVHDIQVTHLGDRKIVIRTDVKIPVATMIKIRAVVLVTGNRSQVDYIGKVTNCILKDDRYHAQLLLTYCCKAGEALIKKVAG